MVVRRKNVAKPVLPPLKHQPSLSAGTAAPVMAQIPQSKPLDVAPVIHAPENAVIVDPAPSVVMMPTVDVPPPVSAPITPPAAPVGGGFFFDIVDMDEPELITAPQAAAPSLDVTPEAPVSAEAEHQPIVAPVAPVASVDATAPAVVMPSPAPSAPNIESLHPEPVAVVAPPAVAPPVVAVEKPLSATSTQINQADLSASPDESKIVAKRAKPPRLRRSGTAREEVEIVSDEDTTIGTEVRVLTGDDGEFKLPPDVQSLVCYLSDGRVLVSKSHRTDARVRAFIARLENIKRVIRVLHVDFSVVESAYQSAKEAKTVEKFNESDMQQAAYALFSRAADERSSDIHIRVSETDNTQIYLRIIGDMEMIEEHPYAYGHALILAIYQAMTDQADATFTPMSPQDARIGKEGKLPRSLTGIRVATLPQVGGNVMILRLLYKDTRQTSDLGELGFSEGQVEAFMRLRRRTTGIIFNSGPTGAGKSTTLQRALTGVIQETEGRKNIITVEDPPEYPIQGAVQVPVTNAETEEKRNEQFQTAIRAALRSDPDIMMIGEIRDGAAAKLAIASAMTGHPTWTSIHANSALDIFDRLVDMNIHINKLSSHTVISGLIAQRLVKVLCPNCRETIENAVAKKLRDPDDVKRILEFFPEDKHRIFVRGEGCDECNGGQPGYTGRTLIAEVVETDKEFMRLMRTGDRDGAVRHWISRGGVTMEMHAREKVLEGLIDPFDAEEEVQWTSSHDDAQA